VGILSALATVTGPLDWSGTDPLFYQAQSLEVRGVSRAQALRTVVDGTPGRRALATDRRLYPITARQLASPRWRNYSARFYRRRWTVPALTALLSPLFGQRSLLLASVLGYLAVGLLLLALLARRFAPGTSAFVAIVFLLCWPLRSSSLAPGTDSWGLALLLLALLCGLWVLERGVGWLPLWILTLAVLSFTREDGVVAVLAAFWLALRMRTARAAGLAAGGVLALAPAALLLGTSLQVSLAYVENGYNPPPQTSWSYVITHYWPMFRYTLHSDFTFPQAQGWSIPSSLLWYLGMLLLLAGIVTLLRKGGPDPYFRLIRGTLLGAIVYIAVSINYTNLRLETVFIPALAVGLAVLIQTYLAPRISNDRLKEWFSSSPSGSVAPAGALR
jgi:hypothetical protein